MEPQHSRFGLISGAVILLLLGGALGYYLGYDHGNEEVKVTPTPTYLQTPLGTPESENWETYRNNEYGFELTFPADWKGYTVATETWSGTLDEQSYSGPQIVIRYPQENCTNNYDTSRCRHVPIMVYTLKQWADNPNVSAAAVGPQEQGRNSRYVFATPPRWFGSDSNFAGSNSEEPKKILDTFKTF